MARKKVAKVKDLPGFEKDMDTNVVINTNSDAFKSRRAQKAALQEKEQELLQMKNDIEELKKLVKGLSKG
jgi:hypothetical protein|tara:strand:- start:864 stop:1073 length:210 start_codon:yes stop_codon:yes gene_type:complete